MKRLTAVLASLMISMTALPASAVALEPATYGNEGDGGADRTAGVAAGFTEIITGLYAPDSKEGRDVDRLFMSKLAAMVAPGEPYGFTFAYVDVTGDGLVDLFLFPKMASLRPPESFPQSGGAVYVFARDTTGNWKLVLEGGTMDVALRDDAETGAKDIALIQEYREVPDFIPMGWNGSRFVALKLPEIPAVPSQQ